MFKLLILLAIPLFQVLCLKKECKELLYCGDCVANIACAWCMENNFNESRCGEHEYMKEKCKSNYYPIKKLEKVYVLNNAHFGVNKNKIIQLKPQKVKIEARPGIENIIELFFKPEKDYPLDVYYLVDNSYTMRFHKEYLAKEAKKITVMLETLTNNVLLGFGTFVEKPALPFARKYTHTYSFQNHLSLTNSTSVFEQIVSQIKYNGNLDTPESLFDGLMQAMLCKDEIGWRNDSLKIIIACTDAPYHSAGEGKFVGAFKTNDMKCRLENHTYIDALTYDYPSVSQINKIANEHGYTIIFATDKTVSDVYLSLSKKIKRSIYAELTLTANMSNVINIVQEQYTKLVQKIKFNTNISDEFNVQLSPNCIDSDKDCDIKYKAMKNFTLSITATENTCRKTNQFEITTQTNDMLLLDIEVICSCPCEKYNNKELNEEKCSNNGIYQCGVCKCNAKRYGDQCQCDDVSLSGNNDKFSMDKCKMGNDTLICSGRGFCSCGVCIQCEKGYSGLYCEYDEKRCLNTKNEMCSNNGKCIKEICSCNEDSGWSGEFCHCQDNNCIAPYSDKVCSGRGKCDCGNCMCNRNNTDGKSYIGEYCDYCENCLQKRCELNKHISQICKIIDETVVCDVNSNDNSTDIGTIIMVDKDNLVNYENAKWCSLSTLEDECSIVYKYKYEGVDKKLILIVQKEKDCPPETNMWIIIGATVGSIVLIGLLTVIVWKVLVDLHDKKEFEKFKVESAKAGWDTSMNPLYRAPECNFMNPCFEPSA